MIQYKKYSIYITNPSPFFKLYNYKHQILKHMATAYPPWFLFSFIFLLLFFWGGWGGLVPHCTLTLKTDAKCTFTWLFVDVHSQYTCNDFKWLKKIIEVRITFRCIFINKHVIIKTMVFIKSPPPLPQWMLHTQLRANVVGYLYMSLFQFKTIIYILNFLKCTN